MSSLRLILAPLGATALVLTLSPGGAALAQAPPDAGRVARELQRPAAPLPPPRPPQGSETAAGPPAAEGPQVLVQSFQITGATVVPTVELQTLLADLTGKSLSVGELNAATARITAHYRAMGYSVARAYLPPQDVTGGVVAISVAEGRFDQRRLNNNSQLSDMRIDAYLDDVRGGDVVRGAQIDRGLLLLNDTPGVANARAALQPGASVGTSDLVVEVSPSAPFAANLGLDNYGNRYTGVARASAGLIINSPLRIGDQLSLDAVTSGRDLTYGRVAYQIPIGADGLRVGAAYFDTRYRLGEEFRALSAHGKATSASLFVVYPFIRSQRANLSGAATLEQKDLTDIVEATTTVTDKRVRLATFGLLGNRPDHWGGGGVTGLDLSVVAGDLAIQSPTARAIDALSARTAGGYARLAVSLSRMQRVTVADYLLVTVSGQRASKNLDSSEKFTLGGMNGVRAYPQGEGVGDEGELLSAEWRHDFSSWLQGAVFYDAGSVRINRDPFGPPGVANRRDVSGAGLGLYASLARVELKAAVAWRTSGGRPTSVPASAVTSPTIWLQANMGF